MRDFKLVFHEKSRKCEVKNCDHVAVYENDIREGHTGELYFTLNLCPFHDDCLKSFDLESAIRMNKDKGYIVEWLEEQKERE